MTVASDFDMAGHFRIGLPMTLLAAKWADDLRRFFFAACNIPCCFLYPLASSIILILTTIDPGLDGRIFLLSDHKDSVRHTFFASRNGLSFFTSNNIVTHFNYEQACQRFFD